MRSPAGVPSRSSTLADASRTTAVTRFRPELRRQARPPTSLRVRVRRVEATRTTRPWSLCRRRGLKRSQDRVRRLQFGEPSFQTTACHQPTNRNSARTEPRATRAQRVEGHPESSVASWTTRVSIFGKGRWVRDQRKTSAPTRWLRVSIQLGIGGRCGEIAARTRPSGS